MSLRPWRATGEGNVVDADKRGVALAILGVGLISALAGGAWWLRKNQDSPWMRTIARASGPRAVHFIMIDRSDPISGQQAQRIRPGNVATLEG